MSTEKNEHLYLTKEPLKFFQRAGDPKAESELLQTVAEFAARQLGANACSIFLRDREKENEAVQVAGTGFQELKPGQEPYRARIVPPDRVNETPEREQDKLGITGWIMSTGLPLLAEDNEALTGHPHHLGKTGNPGLVKTFLGVPVRGLEHSVIGVIKAEKWADDKGNADDIPPFTESDECVLANLALATARCLEYLKLAASSSSPQLALNAWIGDVIALAASEEPDLSSFASVTAEMLCAAADAESCSIYLLDERPAEGKDQTRFLTQIGGHGFQDKGNRIRSYKLLDREPEPHNSHEEGLTAYIARSGETVYEVGDSIRNHPAHKGAFDHENLDANGSVLTCAAFLGIPLRVGAEIIGVAKLENSTQKFPPPMDEDDPFPVDLRRQVNVIVQHAALTIWRLRYTANSRYAMMERSSETIRSILSSVGDLEDLVENAIQAVGKQLKAKDCAIFLREGDKLVQNPKWAFGYFHGSGERERHEYDWVPADQIQQNPAEDQKVGLTVWIASMGQTVVAHSYEQLSLHPHHRGKYNETNHGSADKGCDTFIGGPLRVGDETFGVLKIENKMIDGQPAQFSKEDELVFDLLAASIANAIHHLREQGKKNLDDFRSKCHVSRTVWALGLVPDRQGLSGFEFEMPPLNDDAVVVRTLSLGICGTDLHSFGGKNSHPHGLIGFHEVVGEVAWIGPKVDDKRINIGDIVVPVVRRCQIWNVDPAKPREVHFRFEKCDENHLCSNYRRADACPKGEYAVGSDNRLGYLSRGTGKCHGFGSEYFVDTAEWLVTVCTRDELERFADPDDKKAFISRVILVEPLAVVWKMKREIEQVRPVRPLKDRLLTLGLGPIGFLATELMCRMYPGLKATAVDKFDGNKNWINQICQEHKLEYLRLEPGEKWHPNLNTHSDQKFDIIIEATGRPQDVISNAIDVLAPNGILVLLSVTGENDPADMPANVLNAVVKKNGKIIGSVNESRQDFENAVEFLKAHHYGRASSDLDVLRHDVPLDPVPDLRHEPGPFPRWKALDDVKRIKAKKAWERDHGPKIVLRAP